MGMLLVAMISTVVIMMVNLFIYDGDIQIMLFQDSKAKSDLVMVLIMVVQVMMLVAVTKARGGGGGQINPSSPPRGQRRRERRRRWWKRPLKREFTLFKNSSLLFHVVQFVKCWSTFLEMNCKGLYLCLRKELQNRCLVFTYSTKREFRQFHVEVAQRWQRNVQRRAIHVQSCCFIAFLTFSLPSSSSLLKLPNDGGGSRGRFHLPSAAISL